MPDEEKPIEAGGFSPAGDSASSASDAQASDESGAILAGKLVALERKSAFKGHVHRLSIGGLYLAFAAYVIAVGIWLWHIFELYNIIVDYRLSDSNLSKLQGLLLGSFVGGLAAQFWKKVLDD